MRAAGLDHRPELLGLGGKGRLQFDEGGEQRFLDRHRRGQLQGRRDRVVRALAAIDVVVGVDRPTLAEPLRREVGHDLVHVRVGRCPRARLVDVDRELGVVVAIGHRRGCRCDGPCHVRLEQAQLAVRLRGGQLDQGQGPDEPAGERLARDREVEDRALR
jgi:hypothetical protein